MATKRFTRTIFSGALMALVAGAMADFPGPAPLAWRWVQPTSVAPVGAPLVDGDIIYAAVGNRMYSLDRETGNRRWQYPLVEPVPGYFRSAPVKVDNVIVAAADNKSLYAVDATNGQAKWSYLAPSAILGQPVVVGKNVVFAMTDGTLGAVNGETGEPFWERPYRLPAGVLGGMAALNNAVILGTNRAELMSIDMASQKVNWTTRFGVLGPESTPVVYQGNVYVSAGLYLISVNGATGTGRWQRTINEALATPPAVTSTGFFVASRNGKGMLLDSNGALKLRTPITLPSTPLVAPTGVGNTFVQPTANGSLILIDAATGAVLWDYLIRPLPSSQPSTGGGAMGGPPGGLGGPGRGGAPGGGGPGGGFSGGGAPGGGAPGGGGQGNSGQPPVTIPAAGSAAFSGNSLLILARDGSLLNFDRQFGADLTPPKVDLLFPNAGDQGSSTPSMEILLRVEDEASGVNPATLQVSADNTPLQFEFGRDGIVFIRISSAGKNPPLRPGRRSINVTVKDWMGNETKTSFALIVDPALRPFMRPSGNAQSGQGGPGGGPGGGGGGGGLGNSGDGR